MIRINWKCGPMYHYVPGWDSMLGGDERETTGAEIISHKGKNASTVFLQRRKIIRNLQCRVFRTVYSFSVGFCRSEPPNQSDLTTTLASYNLTDGPSECAIPLLSSKEHSHTFSYIIWRRHGIRSHGTPWTFYYREIMLQPRKCYYHSVSYN